MRCFPGDAWPAIDGAGTGTQCDRAEPMQNTTLCASIGCFIGLVLTLWSGSRGIKRAALDGILGASGGLLMAWFVSPISESANDPDSLNVAAIVAASVGAL